MSKEPNQPKPPGRLRLALARIILGRGKSAMSRIDGQDDPRAVTEPHIGYCQDCGDPFDVWPDLGVIFLPASHDSDYLAIRCECGTNLIYLEERKAWRIMQYNGPLP